MKLLFVGLCACLAVLWGVAFAASASKDAAPILIDFPQQGSIFPPEISPPTFLWRETAGGAIAWRVEVLFNGHGPKVRESSPGEKPRCL